jgi:hypothetical protein
MENMEHHHFLWLNQHQSTISGGWFFATPLQNDGVKVTWDDDFSIYGKKIPHVPNHQHS